MSTFYLFVAILTGTAFAADLMLRYVIKIGRFGLDKTWGFLKGKVIPIEQFFPNTLSKLNAFVFIFSLSGALYLVLGIVWYISAIFGIFTSMLANFFTVHFLFPARERMNGIALPKSHVKSGDKVTVCERIPGDAYGSVLIQYKGRKYDFPALSANETDIEVNTQVLVVAEQDGIFWVETEKEVFDILNEKN